MRMQPQARNLLFVAVTSITYTILLPFTTSGVNMAAPFVVVLDRM
jgi:hypothetical protein